jgi:transcriptional regulator with XRE-family HTH domain
MTIQQKLARLVRNQSEVSRKTGISQSAISEMISGKRNPYAWQAAAIARALGVSCDYLLFDDLESIPRPELTDEERELVKLIREMGVVEARRRLLQLGMPTGHAIVVAEINRDATGPGSLGRPPRRRIIRPSEESPRALEGEQKSEHKRPKSK